MASVEGQQRPVRSIETTCAVVSAILLQLSGRPLQQIGVVACHHMAICRIVEKVFPGVEGESRYLHGQTEHLTGGFVLISTHTYHRGTVVHPLREERVWIMSVPGSIPFDIGNQGLHAIHRVLPCERRQWP